MELKVAFFGSDEFAADFLKHLVENGVSVALVITQPDRPKGRGKRVLPTPVKEEALRLGLEVAHPKKLSDLKKKLEDFDVGIVVSFGRIIPPSLLSAPRWGLFNVHPSLLPKYRGAAPVVRALENGEEETGVTIFKVTEELDAGPIALQRRVKVGSFEAFGELNERLKELGKEMVLELLEILENGELQLKEQDHSRATYAPKISKDDPLVDFTFPCEKVKDKIRAYDPKPGAFSFLKGQKVKLLSVMDMGEEEGDPGRVLEITKRGAWIGCGKGSVLVQKIQFPGKKPIDFWSAKNGRKIEEGDVFSAAP